MSIPRKVVLPQKIMKELNLFGAVLNATISSLLLVTELTVTDFLFHVNVYFIDLWI